MVKLTMNKSVMKCTKCRIVINFEDKTEHYRSPWHNYNVRRSVAKKTPLTKEQFETRIAEHYRIEREIQQKKAVVYRCKICRKTFKSEATCEQHMKSKKHKEKVKRAAEKKGEELTMQEVIQSKVINDIQDDASEASSQAIPLQNIPLRSCLFCPHECETLSDSLEHMLHVHNFYIPFLEYVTSVEGLLMYLGRVVGEHGACMTCNKTFNSLEGVWHHMNAKGHNRITLWDQDTPLDEFFDFNKERSSSVSEGSEDSLGQLVLRETQRHPVSLNEFDELVLSDGCRIGHRKHKRIYDQAVRLGDTRDCVVIPKLTARYRALCMPGYGLPDDHNKLQQHLEYTKKMNTWRIKNEMKHNNTNFFKIYV